MLTKRMTAGRILAVGFAAAVATTLVSCAALFTSTFSVYDITGITVEPKTNGYLFRIAATSEIKHVEAWIGANNWLYITIPDTNFNQNGLNELKRDSVVAGVKLFRYKESVQLTVKLNESFAHVTVLRYPGSNDIYVALYKETADANGTNSQ